MRVDWAIPCRYAEVHDNLATIVGAGIDAIHVPALPWTVEVTVAVRFVAPLEEFGSEVTHEIRCVARDSSLTEVGGLGATMAIPAPDDAREDWLLGLQMPIVISFEATHGDTYTLEISVDDDAYPVPIHVGTRPPA